MRFNLLIVSVVLVFSIISAYFFYSLNKVQDYRDYSEMLSDLEIHYLNLRRFEQHFLLRYQEDRAFFTTKKNKYIDKHDNAAEKFKKTLGKLTKDPITQDLHLEENYGKIATYHKRYNNIFEQLYTNIYRKGSGQTGIQKEMLTAAEEANQAESNPYLKEYNLRLTQIAEQYLQNKDPKSYREFLLLFSELNHFIESGFEPKYRYGGETELIDSTHLDSVVVEDSESVSPEFTAGINNFKKQFSALFKIDTEIGFSYKEGLQGELRAEIHKIDPEIEEHIKPKVESRLSRFIQQTGSSAYIFFGALLIGLILLIWQFSNSILRPVNRLKAYISPLSKGSLPDETAEVQGKDEISEMTERVNELIVGLKQTTDFASAIGRGQFDTRYKPLSTDDVLGNSLLEMRQNLNQAKIDEEMRKREDDMRKWANEGLAKFNDILRHSSGNISELSGIVIRELVHFLEANQGGIFVHNEEEEKSDYLELVAAYAYGQEKKKSKRILPGEGLVGTAAIEKETIYMTDIPENYITITSGLGSSNPRSLLIVPMKVEDEIFGVIEIASFNEFNSNAIDFVEKVSENIAASLSITRINTRTADLLEQSQQAAEQMAVQEEEMRRSFEELKHTQEESAKREAEMSSILTAINSSSLVIEINTKGYITSVNNKLLNSLGLDEQDIVGKMHHDFVNPKSEKDYSEFWYKLKNGEYQKRTEKIVIGDRAMWFSVTYTPIKDETGEVQKVLTLATDLTETKELEFELREQAEAMQAQEEEMRQNLEELHSTQDEMAKKQEMLEKANLEAKSREQILKEAVNRANENEQELQIKIGELNSITGQLEDEHERMIDLNHELAVKENETSTQFQAIDKNNLVAQYLPNGTLLYANELFLKTFGYEKRDIKGRHQRMFMHEDERRKEEYKEFWNNLRAGQAFESECRRVTKDGKVMFFKGIYRPIKDIKGKTYKIIEILSDITQLKRSNAHIESRMENINLTNAFVEMSRHQVLISANNLFAEVLGYQPEELEEKPYTDLIPQKLADTGKYERFKRDLQRGKILSGTWEFLSKDNEKHFFQGTFSPIRDPEGSVEKIMFLGQDVTESVKHTEILKAKETESEHIKSKLKRVQDELDECKRKLDDQ